MPSMSVRATLGGVPASGEDVLARRFDHVIIGGGAAGCVLARRLSEDRHVQVLLVEAGDRVADPAVDAPQAWPGLAGGAFDWAYVSTPQAGLLDRTVPQPRGKGLGGSTLINALGFQRGGREAYEAWAEASGDPGWGPEGLWPWFRRLETCSAGADAHRGGDGPLHVQMIRDVADQNPFSRAFHAAGVAAGHPANPDWNGARPDGAIWTQLTVRDGRRDSAASAWLEPVLDRPNLAVLTGATATGLVVSQGRAEAVRLLLDGQLHEVRAERELLLCAGAIDTPRLLLLSGIGDADTLRRLGIAPVHHLPGVGRNLQDHPLVPGLLFRSPQPVPLSAYNHGETMVVTQSRQGRGFADLQLMALSVPFLAPGLGTPPADSVSIVPALLAPFSRGGLALASADPRVPARIDPGYLADPRDVEALVDAIGITREIMRQPELRDWVAGELVPGPAMTDRAALAHHVRRAASPFYHPVSTCRMGQGNDPEAVVDAQCRIIGLAGVRIVDASIFPSIPHAMTMAATLAVAERAADLIRKPALPLS